jgi:hypothetical protein
MINPSHLKNLSFRFVCVLALLLGGWPAHAENTAHISRIYFPVLPAQSLPDTEPQLVPMLSTWPLAGDHRGIERAIVVIHDGTRDPRPLLQTIVSMAGTDNATTIAVAPQFYIESDIARYADNLPDDGKYVASWTPGGWGQGDDSIPGPGRKPISSFTVIDLLLLYLADTTQFPDMKYITLAGYDDGARFVQTYAAVGRAPDALELDHMPVRFVVANPPAFFYATPARFRGGKQGFGLPDPAACLNTNQWPYGLDQLNPYAKRVGPNAVKMNISGRSVSFLIGANSGHNDPMPDISCAAQQQGRDRLERVGNYRMYLASIFGDTVVQRQNFSIVPKASYNPEALLTSPCAASVMFGDGVCVDVSGGQ